MMLWLWTGRSWEDWKESNVSDDVKGDDGEVCEEDKEEVEDDDDTVEEEKEDNNICEYIKFSKLKAW